MAKTIIITGASGNLGTVTVKKMLDSDHRVIAVSGSAEHLGFAKGNKNFEHRTINLMKEPDVYSFIDDVILRYEIIDAALLLAGGFAMGGIDSTGGEELKK